MSCSILPPHLQSSSNSYYSEPVVGIAELRWQAAPGGTSTSFDPVSPSPTTRRAPGDLLVVDWILLSSSLIKVGLVPVQAPLVHIVSQIINAIRIGLAKCYAMRTTFPSRSVVFECLRILVTPGVQLLL